MDISMFVLVTCPPMFVLLYIFLNWWVINHKSVCIVVLGDLGRSPRMQYHSLSFAKEGYSVDFVGYSGTRPHEELVKNENITMYYVSTPPNFNKFFPTLVAYILKVIWQSVTLGIKLLLLPKSHLIMLQNPPSIPPMIVAVVVCVLRGSYLLIDWHNYGYTILGLSVGERHPLVKISRVYEKIVGRASRYNLCVTDAMKKDLERNWNICAKTLHDRPPSIFREFSIGEKHDLFVKLSEDYPVFRSSDLSSDSTVFTKKSPDGTVNYLKERPALLISSTSWTEDEDFGILLKSLQDYEKMANMDETMPSILCVITGKGPLKEYYSKKLQELHWKKIQYCLPWLKAEDYPVLLGSADLGVCLHKSSSGLDLPMKVVDMFGCGLPVCAVGYNCIDELVHDRVNGRIFDTSEELCQQIKELLSDFKGEQKTLSSMRHNLKQFQALRWHQNWKNVVLPLISDG